MWEVSSVTSSKLARAVLETLTNDLIDWSRGSPEVLGDGVLGAGVLEDPAVGS